MTLYLSVEHISKSYGRHTVLDDVSLTLGAGQRVGLVGANGAGKSTLLKIITGELSADSGMVRIFPRVRVGYLAQTIATAEGHTLGALIAESLTYVKGLEAQMRNLEARMGEVDGEALAEVLEIYGEISTAYEHAGGYEIEARVDAVLTGLGVAHLPRDRDFATLSGGEKTRVGLALLLIDAPDVLLLDEPANHLDLKALAWLEDYLQVYRGGLVVVSHDRHFLNRVVNSIVEIDEHSHHATRHTGTYDDYHRAKVRALRQWQTDYSAQEEEIKDLRYQLAVKARTNGNNRYPRDGDKFEAYKRAQTHDATVARRVRQAQERLDRILADPIPRPPEPLTFKASFDPHMLAGKYPLTVHEVCKAYDGQAVLRGVTLALNMGERVMIVGENGSGKSTLLRLLAGVETPDQGAIQWQAGVRVGYLDQEHTGFNPSHTLFEAFRDGLPEPDQALKAQLIGMGLFRYNEFEKPVTELSKGQQHKLLIARIIAGGANVLLLDEPTNYISFDVLESFETALKDFPGAVVAVSHDRRFIERFMAEGGRVLEMVTGQLREGERV